MTNPQHEGEHAREDSRVVRAYHEASKHDFGRYADGPMGMDWKTQPDPFRTYQGAPLHPLARAAWETGDGPDYAQTLAGAVTPACALDAQSLARLFFDSLALSAWKSISTAKWALRVNPSSGNLHPTEGYWLSGPVPGLFDQPSVSHYRPREHALEQRATFDLALWNDLTREIPGLLGMLGLTSIHWRESWKYGERAFRYCNHDVGHAIATVTIAAAALGWRAVLLDAPSHATVAAMLGVETDNTVGAEPEVPDILLAIFPRDVSIPELGTLTEIATRFRSLAWQGTPNTLSPSRVHWPWIERVARASHKPETAPRAPAPATLLPRANTLVESAGTPLRKLVHQRRSAVDFDGHTGITADGFFGFLDRLGPECVPFTALPWTPRVHLGIFVHRVRDLDPGLYVFARSASGESALRQGIASDFEWTAVRPGLFRLGVGDATRAAKQVSCHQDIASDGAFSLGMFAEFDAALESDGAWAYPRLFWECGMIGQMLYLEAEALGIRGTGIGCFFDDRVHEVFTLTGTRLQSLYHFTVGGPVEDTRLTTLPAYG